MKSIKILSIATLVVALALSSFTYKHNTKPTGVDKGFAVIELFTSEGCSSCPPADAVVAKVEKESAGKPIYILAFHVDYWNRLGWKDVFSSAAYSQRQNQYARWLNLSSVYTPQIVVNGRTEFVGSEEGTLRNAIKINLAKNASAQISLSDITINQNKAELRYQTQGETANSVLLLAVVQKSAQTKVERGENSGRTLLHVQIVRGIESIPLKGDKGIATIELPKDFDAHGSEIIAFVQNTADGEITGATKSVLN
ncbi:thioredoxin family protein [Mucilaginibacter sp. L196]|uniref:DUF1223 domain-containing protein n=1 Tax=Mucilaginibacter sp. L196 TaxID=1641870 RepID=UPI00131D25F9|nr:DUF1223 domain-containing protein [Mucilaginibacter sp. L196]